MSISLCSSAASFHWWGHLFAPFICPRFSAASFSAWSSYGPNIPKLAFKTWKSTQEAGLAGISGDEEMRPWEARSNPWDISMTPGPIQYLPSSLVKMSLRSSYTPRIFKVANNPSSGDFVIVPSKIPPTLRGGGAGLEERRRRSSSCRFASRGGVGRPAQSTVASNRRLEIIGFVICRPIFGFTIT